MDEIDLAQQHEAMHRENALRAHFRRRDNFLESECRSPGLHPEGAGPGQKRLCCDCGEEIEPARLKVMPFAVRCTECQAKHERRLGR